MNRPADGVAQEVVRERARQDAKWGEQDHPDLSVALKGFAAESVFSAMNVLSAKKAKARVDALAALRLLGYADIALEEFAEAIEAAANEDTAALRTELVQTAAVLVAWIEAIDRRTGRQDER